MDEKALQKTFFITKIISVTFIMAIFIYWYVAVLALRDRPASSGSSAIGKFRIVLMVMAFIEISCLSLVKNIVISSKSFDNIAVKLQIAHLICYALCESLAIYGIVLSYVSGNIREYYPFAAASVFGMALYWPKWREWVQWAETNGK